MVRMVHWPLPMERQLIKLGLERMQELLQHLGNPHDQMPPTIHIAGTNGKGSTIAFMKAILEASGLKVHVYTSPHLVRFNERIVLAGEQIADNYLYQLLEECRIIAEQHDMQVSFFEGITAAAFLAFARTKADILLLETGLGGRLDATNIISKPIITIITPISLDHVNILGNTLTKIAYEKACIMKPCTPCVVSMQEPESHVVIAKYADNVGALLVRLEYDFGILFEGDQIYYKADDYKFKFPQLSLSGDHQYINAASAIAAIKLLKGVVIPDDVINYGLLHASWPGRLQQITYGKIHNLLLKNWEIWLDGAHNHGGAIVIAHWLKTKQDTPVYMIMGITKGRDIKNILRPFAGILTQVIGVTVQSEPLSYSGNVIVKHAQELGLNAIVKNDVEDAILYLKAHITYNKVRIIITGSLFLIADALVYNQN